MYGAIKKERKSNEGKRQFEGSRWQYGNRNGMLKTEKADFWYKPYFIQTR